MIAMNNVNCVKKNEIRLVRLAVFKSYFTQNSIVNFEKELDFLKFEY
jgi:hypothetical protein